MMLSKKLINNGQPMLSRATIKSTQFFIGIAEQSFLMAPMYQVIYQYSLEFKVHLFTNGNITKFKLN